MTTESLSPAKLEELRKMLHPVLEEVKRLRVQAQFLIEGFLTGASCPDTTVSVDFITGSVTIPEKAPETQAQ